MGEQCACPQHRQRHLFSPLHGQLIAPGNGTYRFYLTSDDGARLSLSTQMLIDDLSDHAPRTLEGTATLSAGQSTFTLEYYDDTGKSSLKLERSGPGVTRQVIPTARLFAVSPPAPTPMPSSKKLIGLGWDSPTPGFVHANIAQMEQRPFDGVVMRLNAGKTIFNKTAHPDSAFAVDRSDLNATHFTKFSHNFVSI